jgi:cellulose biosynthesis protein BcsQ
MNVANAQERHSAKRIAIFNHKGGVGKTTLTLNIASAVAGLGKRVLLVDCDPQCNLTSYLLEESVVDDLLDKSDSDRGRTLWSSMKPIVEGEGNIRPIPPYELHIRNLFLVPGDIRLSEYEAELNSLWVDCLQRKVRGFRGTAAISALVNHIAATHNIDFVFFDSGPNIGPLNRSVLLDCDFLIIPAACDLFSVRALKTLGHTLAGWVRDWKTILALAPDGVYKLPGRPVIMGYIPQRFRVYRGTAAGIQARYMPRIERHVKSDVLAVLRAVDPSLAELTPHQLLIGEVKDLSSLVTHSQEQGVPVSLTDAGTPEQRRQARAAFSGIAKKILQRSGRI